MVRSPLTLPSKSSPNTEPNLHYEELLIQSVKKTSDFVLLLNSDGKLIFANEVSQQFFLSNRFNTDIFAKIFEIEIARAVAEKKAFTHERALDHSGLDGEYFSINITPLLKSGEVQSIFINLHSIHNLKESERRLFDENQRLDAQARAMNIFELISESDTLGRITYANEKLCALSKYSAKELIGQNFKIFSSHTHSKSFWREFWEQIGQGKMWVGEICNRAKDGSLFWLRAVIIPIVDEQGRIFKFVKAARDITEQKQMQESVRDSERRFRELINNINFATVGLDLQGHVSFCNETFAALSGWSVPEILGSDWFIQFVPPELRDEVGRLFLENLTKQSGYTQVEHEVITRNGERRLIQWSMSPSRNAEGDITGVTSIGKDITERRNNEKKVEAFHKQAERHKEEVMAFVCHELRSPLMSLRSGIELLKGVELSPEEEKALHKKNEELQKIFRQFESHIERIDRISRDLLASSLDSSPGIEFTLKPLRLNAFLQKLCERFQWEVSKKDSLSLVYTDCLSQLEGSFDASRLDQALSNIISNAIKYSKPEGGKIEISLLAPQPDQAIICIQDQGFGIPPENLGSIFEMFSRGNNIKSSTIPGFGVGLKIAKDFIEKQGGLIEVESELGTGTRFSIKLPLNSISL